MKSGDIEELKELRRMRDEIKKVLSDTYFIANKKASMGEDAKLEFFFGFNKIDRVINGKYDER